MKICPQPIPLIVSGSTYSPYCKDRDSLKVAMRFAWAMATNYSHVFRDDIAIVYTFHVFPKTVIDDDDDDDDDDEDDDDNDTYDDGAYDDGNHDDDAIMIESLLYL